MCILTVPKGDAPPPDNAGACCTAPLPALAVPPHKAEQLGGAVLPEQRRALLLLSDQQTGGAQGPPVLGLRSAGASLLPSRLPWGSRLLE